MKLVAVTVPNQILNTAIVVWLAKKQDAVIGLMEYMAHVLNVVV